MRKESFFNSAPRFGISRLTCRRGRLRREEEWHGDSIRQEIDISEAPACAALLHSLRQFLACSLADVRLCRSTRRTSRHQIHSRRSQSFRCSNLAWQICYQRPLTNSTRFPNCLQTDCWNPRNGRTQRFKLVVCIDRVHLGAGVAGQLLPDFL